MDTQHTIFTDQTGIFPVQSYRGFKYILILLHCDTNSILAEPLKDKYQEEFVRAFTSLKAIIYSKGFTITHHILDNEAPLYWWRPWTVYLFNTN